MGSQLDTFKHPEASWGLVLPYTEIPKGIFAPTFGLWCQPGRLSSAAATAGTPLSLWTPIWACWARLRQDGETCGPWGAPSTGAAPCTFRGAHMWLPTGNSPSEHSVQHLRHELDIFTYISSPDTGPKHACYRLSYFPSSTDLIVYIFEQNCKSRLFSPEKHKKASLIIAHVC